MKRWVLGPVIVFLLLCTFFLFSAGYNVTAEGEVSVKEALDSGDLSGRFVSKGAASGHVSDLFVESNAASDITLDLANSGLEGMVLVNPYEDEQDEVITDTPGTSYQGTYTPKENVTIGPGGSVTIPVIGYCMNFDLGTPTTSIEFDLSITSQKTSINEIIPVVNILQTYEYPEGWTTGHVQRVEQMAIWTSQGANTNVPLSRYSGRGYTLNENDIQVVSDILNLSGKDASNVAALTGLEKEDGGSGILEQIPWFTILLIIIAIIMVAIVGSMKRARKKRRKKHPPRTGISAYEYYKKKKRECEKLKSRCQDAYSKADEADQKAKAADEKAQKAKHNSKRAKAEREKAELELEEFELDKREKDETWAESDGKRITSYDLKLKNEASKVVWEQYQSGEIDSETLQKVWKDLGEDEALNELRKKDKTDREDPLKDALKEAILREDEAKAKTKVASDESARTKDFAKRNRDYSNTVCKKAHECKKALKEAAKAAGVRTKEELPHTRERDAEKKSHEIEKESEDGLEEPEEPELDDNDEKDDELELEEDLLGELEPDENKDKDAD